MGVEITKGICWGAEVVGQISEGGAAEVERERLLKRCRVKASVVAMVQECVRWLRLWDSVMEYGVQHTWGLQMLIKAGSCLTIVRAVSLPALRGL